MTTFLVHWAPVLATKAGAVTAGVAATATLATGLGVAVSDGAIVVVNAGGAHSVDAGQFGFAPSVNPPAVAVGPDAPPAFEPLPEMVPLPPRGDDVLVPGLYDWRDPATIVRSPSLVPVSSRPPVVPPPAVGVPVVVEPPVVPPTVEAPVVVPPVVPTVVPPPLEEPVVDEHPDCALSLTQYAWVHEVTLTEALPFYDACSSIPPEEPGIHLTFHPDGTVTVTYSEVDAPPPPDPGLDPDGPVDDQAPPQP